VKRALVILGGAALLVVLAVVLYPGREEKVTLRLYSGAGLRRAVDELCREFESETGIRVEPDYGGSGLVLSRAREDGDADLFLPGDVWYVDQLQELAGKVEGRVEVAYFVPTIIVARGNPKKVESLASLARKDVTVGLGKSDACQIGRTSARILARAGVELKGLAAQESLTVNELGIWVKMKAVDAAIVWDAIAANLAADVDVVPIPKEQNKISRVVLARLKSSRHPEAAGRFLDFVAGPKGREILESKGFRVEAP
jgi:molybdate transport system substrate-binding protein